MSSVASILEQVIDPSAGTLGAELARYILSLDFPAAGQARYAALTSKAQDGILAPEERAELEDFLSVNDFLMIVQSKARASLAKHPSAA